MGYGQTGEIYNVGADNHRSNLEIVNWIVEQLNKPHSLIKHVADRPSHDRRYALNWQKISHLGWEPQTKFEDVFRSTVNWYNQNRSWWVKHSH